MTTSNSDEKVESGLLPNVIVSYCPSILELFTAIDKPLLVCRDAPFVLGSGLHGFNGVRRLDLQLEFCAGCWNEVRNLPDSKREATRFSI